MIISKVYVGLSMFVINATCNGCKLEALNFGALNVVFNTWVFLGFLLTKSGLNSKSHVTTLYIIRASRKNPYKWKNPTSKG